MSISRPAWAASAEAAAALAPVTAAKVESVDFFFFFFFRLAALDFDSSSCATSSSIADQSSSFPPSAPSAASGAGTFAAVAAAAAELGAAPAAPIDERRGALFEASSPDGGCPDVSSGAIERKTLISRLFIRGWCASKMAWAFWKWSSLANAASRPLIPSRQKSNRRYLTS